MSLADFQRAFARSLAVSGNEADGDLFPVLFGKLELEPLEVDRLRMILNHPGMKANRLLVRSNRAIPIQSALPLTCGWLQGEMSAIIEAWLEHSKDASVQYQRESVRFAEWIPGYLIRSGEPVHPALDALGFELGLAELIRLATDSDPNPTVVLEFRYDPDVILRGWNPQVESLDEPVATELLIENGCIILRKRH